MKPHNQSYACMHGYKTRAREECVQKGAEQLKNEEEVRSERGRRRQEVGPHTFLLYLTSIPPSL